MSLNTSTTPDGRGVLVYNGEAILLYSKHVLMSFDHNPEPAFKGEKKGALYLTTHRIIFVSGETNKPFRSMALPFFGIQEVKLEQPMIGSNYLKGIIQALPGGNFSGEVKWRLTFPKGGCIDFGHALLHAVHLASQQRPMASPPEYHATHQATYAAAPAKYYAQPSAPMYGGIAANTAAFPERPAEGNLYVYDQPPPYPGIAPASAYYASPPMGYPAPPYPGAAGAPAPGYAPLPQYENTPYPAVPQYAPPTSQQQYAQAPPLPQKQ